MNSSTSSTSITAAQAALDIDFSINCAFVAGLSWFTGLALMDVFTFPAYFLVAVGSLLCQFAQTGMIETIYECITTHATNDPPFGSGVVNIVNAITSILAAVLTLGATWQHTYKTVRLAHATGEDAPLGMLLLRDGTLYFGTSLLIDVFLTAVDFIHTTDATLVLVLDALSPSFATVILTHFLLNLKSISNPSPSLTTAISLPDLQFVGPYDLGGSLILGDGGDFLDEDVEGETEGDGMGMSSVSELPSSEMLEMIEIPCL
ncbi:hypothetical protein FOMPIDRAFT_110428 [Fomitopsis schrenkii]|uniref:Uncharacterized protein n=1 Tax=Fomitopsis schrenkii TaxID=2126942 RepID=S8E820_FOMSC|nr:hypothetical protein FOMPIDRAFT_110428 [Fomitopsis schrenkii]